MTQEQIKELGSVAERLQSRGLDEEHRLLVKILAEVRSPGKEVPASTAAEILRVTPQTIRNWVRGGVLEGRRDATGHFLVTLASLEPSIRLGQVLPDVTEGLPGEEIDAAIERVRARRRALAESRG